MSNAISNITLCRVPITPTNQLDFSTESEQLSYFSSKAVKNITNCRYQPRTGQIKITGYVDSLRNCNYGYYTNSYQGVEKTYYFWIVAKNYLAREVTALTIQIDVFQTWQFDINFNSCMIEREHVDNDGYGLNTIPEDFELGDYVTIVRKKVACLSENPCFILAHSDNGGGIFGKTYNGCHMSYYGFNDTEQLATDIQALADDGKADSIAYIYQFPNGLADLSLSAGESIAELIGECTQTETFNSSEQSQQFKFNGGSYTPLNNKLYCYPFMFITIKNPSGGNVVLKIENFKDQSNITFEIQGVLTANPTITCTPYDYNGKDRAYDDSISLDEYGLCSWNNDNYANWFAQHRNSISAQSDNAYSSMKTSNKVMGNNYDNALANRDTTTAKGILGTGASTLGALGNGNIIGGASNLITGGTNTLLDYNQNTRNAGNDLYNSDLLNTNNYQNEIRSIMASVQDASVQPNTCKGSTASSGLDIARGTATFFIEQTGIKPEYAKMIDSYFQMFGYQVNAVKKPNYKTRMKWNYLKTINCSVSGDIPFDDCNAINMMFNNGITIWHDDAFMYEYETINNIR